MKITVRYFNMVELALAMAVLAIGISSILVLFPVGINASTNARANDQVPMIADVMLENIKSIVYKLSDWSSLGADIPSTKPADADIKSPSKDAQIMGNLYYTTKDGVYLYENGDFSAVIRVWRDPEYWKDFNIGSVPLNAADKNALNKIAAVIYVEISWPVDMVYDDLGDPSNTNTRVDSGNVRTYRLELFNTEAKNVAP